MAGLRKALPAVEEWAQHVGYRLIDGHTGFATPPVLQARNPQKPASTSAAAPGRADVLVWGGSRGGAQEVPAMFLGLLRHCVETAAGGGVSRHASPVAVVAARAEAEARSWLDV